MFRFAEAPPVVNGLSFNAAITFVSETLNLDPHQVAIRGAADEAWLRDTVRACQSNPSALRALYAPDPNTADESPDLREMILAARGGVVPMVMAPTPFQHPHAAGAAVMARAGQISRQLASGHVETADEPPDMNAMIRAARGIQ